MGMVIKRGMWSEARQQLEWIECWLILVDPYQRNIRSMTKFVSPTISEYLVEQELIGVDRTKFNESAIIIRSSLIEK